MLAALREAARRLGTPRLSDVTIFTTLEPCPMCVGALLECDVAALVYAAPNPVCGAAGTVIQLADHPGLGRRLDVVSGIRRGEAEELMGELAGPSPGRSLAARVPGRPAGATPRPPPRLVPGPIPPSPGLCYPSRRRGVRVVDGAALEKRSSES